MSISIVITMITMTMVIIGSYHAYEIDGVPRLFDDSRHFRRPKEPRENRGYVEQCRATNLHKGQLGHVNVFAFLDPSWYYSYRQAVMLELLKKRLERLGFSKILFFVVTPPSNLPEESTENNVEIEAWREISKIKLESQYLLEAEEILFNDFVKKKKGMILVQDTPELGIWEAFRAAKDEVVIIDRCGKLTYQITVPLSILYFPYVKAAILATYKEDPCGPCEEESSTEHDSLDYEEFLLKSVNSGETKIDKDMRAEKTVTTSFQESRKDEDDKDTSTVVPLNTNTYENTMYNTSTEASIVQTEITGSIKNGDSVKDITRFTGKNIEVTSEIPLEEQTHIPTTISDLITEVYGETRDYISLNKEINENNNNSFLAVNNSNTDLITNREDDQDVADVSSGIVKEGQEVSKDTEQEELQIQKYENVPLRIILYAPHLHEENGALKKYTHVVLKTGNPDYHDHFHSKSTTSDQEPVVLKKADSTILNDKKLRKYVHSINESPGTYGEIVDDIDEFNNKNEDTELTDYDYATANDTESNINNAFDSESTILRPSDIDTIDSDTNIKSNDELDSIMYRRLIKHYSKLLTWINYIL